MFGDTKAQDLEQYLEINEQKEDRARTLVMGSKL
jgi:hypothetical protein